MMYKEANMTAPSITDTDLFDTILHLGKMLGLSRSMATVFAILYASDTPLSIETLVEISGLSKSAVSLALRDLSQLNAIQEKTLVGERSRRYCGQQNIAEVITTIVVARLKYPISELRDKLDHSDGSERRLRQIRSLLDTMEMAIATVQSKSQS